MREKGQGCPEPGFGRCVGLEPGGPPAQATGKAPCPVGSVSHWVVPGLRAQAGPHSPSVFI